MSAAMHHDQLASDDDLVRRLLRAQLPDLADLDLRAIGSTGTDNALFRLGDDLVVRLPLRPASALPIDTEHRWLPVLAPLLPLEVPVPVAKGKPCDEFPLPWSVHPWVHGDDAINGELDLEQAAVDLAGFLLALRSIDPTGGPPAREAYCFRGVDLRDRDGFTRSFIEAAAHLVDGEALTAAWDDALAAPVWHQPPTWVHGDVAAGNLVVRDGRLHAVIDWGLLAVGDPACDLLVAWELFEGTSRAAFRSAVQADDATWARARGWALSTAIAALPYYEHTNQLMADQARRKLAAVLAD